MKKIMSVLIFSLAFISLAGLTTAQQLEIEKIAKTNVVIIEFDEPATFQLNIKNNGVTDNFEIYSLVGVRFLPDEKFQISSGETKTLDIEAYPNKNIKSRFRGLFQFQYEIYSPRNGITKDNLLIELIELKDVIDVRPISFQPGESSATLMIKAKNINLSELEIKADSNFFNFQRTLSLEPEEEINFTVPINTDKIKNLVAGTYETNFEVSYKGVKSEKKVDVKYLERGGISVAEKSKGIIIRRTTIEKKNEGNVPTTATIMQKKDIATRLVTTHSLSPTSLSKEGFYVIYNWEKELLPNESLQVTIVTNYTFPLILAAIIVLVLILVNLFLMTPLSLVKKVSHVRTKGGEFALKVTLHLKARNSVSSISLTDHIPHSLKLYEKFGSKPDSIDEKTRTTKWNIARLNAGEERIFSYIVYSKIRVVGKFELPLARATYTHNGRTKCATSNRAIFLSESLREE